MTDGPGSGIVSAGATGLGVIQYLELIPPHILGIILSLLGIVSIIIIILVNIGKLHNTRLQNKILRLEVSEKEHKRRKDD